MVLLHLRVFGWMDDLPHAEKKYYIYIFIENAYRIRDPRVHVEKIIIIIIY